MGKLNIRMTFGYPSAVVIDGTDMHQVSLLAMQIQQVYMLSELRQLSYFLGVEFENLSGNTRFDKAYGLVNHFQNRNELSCMLSYLEEDRPHIDWQSFAERLA